MVMAVLQARECVAERIQADGFPTIPVDSRFPIPIDSSRFVGYSTLT
jgi:hypothetical protein